MFKLAAVGLLNAYQRYLRTALPSACRFSPSCSEYSKQAIIKYGLLKGVVKGAKRLLRCQPFFGRNGFDPLI